MNRRLQLVLLPVAALLIAGAVGFAALAAGGSSSDPLVTLSYLRERFAPTLTEEVQNTITTESASLDTALQSHVAAFRSSLPLTSSSGTATGDYATVNLASGGMYSIDSGEEVLFLSGSVTVGNAAIIDSTTGQTVSAGSALTANHLYLATADCAITAASASTFLIR